jgi:hypothetical protein
MKRRDVLFQIQTLKATKGDAANAPCATEMIKTSGYVNIIDMLLLPLYYAWEHLGFGKLEDVCFEKYLNRTYRRFCQAKDEYIRKMISLLSKVSANRSLTHECKQMVDSLIGIYTSIFMK